MKNPASLPFQPNQSQQQLDVFLQDYYSLSIQVQTLQRHILKIQTQNQEQHKFFNDETQKLKLYIDQCENEIKKRQERELALIDRLKQLQTDRFQELQQQLKSSRKYKKQNDEMKQSFDRIIRQKKIQWNNERESMIKEIDEMNHVIKQMNQKIKEMNLQCLQKEREKQALKSHQELIMLQLASLQSTIIKLKHDTEEKQDQSRVLKEENKLLITKMKEFEIKLQEKQEKQKLKPTPVSISNSCPNCLKISKIHEIEIDKKSKDIECLKKDIECLMTFFQIPE